MGHVRCTRSSSLPRRNAPDLYKSPPPLHHHHHHLSGASHSNSIDTGSTYSRAEKPMEMERMMGCQIPAFGVWNYCSDLPITEYFDLAMQRSCLMKRANDRRRRCAAAEKRLVPRFAASPSPRKPAGPQIKVIRREATKEEEGANAMKRMVARAVDEDLYQVPQQLLYHNKPRKMRKVVWSLWIGCLGMDCIA